MSNFIPNPNGPTDSAYVQGWLSADQNKRDNNKDNRDEQQQQMANEAFSLQKDAIMKKNTIDDGMAIAGKDGGYEGVIDYLKQVDPDRALAFHAAKLKLDKSMMDNDVYAAMVPVQKAKALVEGYGLLGKMGASIMQAKDPQAAQAMYDQMLPMVRGVNPDAPSDVHSAMPMFMLASAQAMPENQLFQANKQAVSSQTEIGKIDLDLRTRINAGIPPNDPTILALIQQRDQAANGQSASMLQKSQAQLRMLQMQQSTAQMQQRMANRKVSASELLNKNLLSASSDFTSNLDNFTNSKSDLETLAKDPSNSYAQAQLSKTFVKLVNGGGTSDGAALKSLYATGAPEALKHIQEMATGKRVWLNAPEVKALTTVMNDTIQTKLKRQQSIESQFQQSVGSYDDGQGGSMVDWSTVRKPSQDYLDFISQPKSAGSIPPDLQSMAADAIKQGAPKEAVQKRIQELMSQNQQGTQNNGQQ